MIKVPAVITNRDQSWVGFHGVAVAHEEVPIAEVRVGAERAFEYVDCPTCPVIGRRF